MLNNVMGMVSVFVLCVDSYSLSLSLPPSHAPSSVQNARAPALSPVTSTDPAAPQAVVTTASLWCLSTLLLTTLSGPPPPPPAEPPLERLQPAAAPRMPLDLAADPAAPTRSHTYTDPSAPPAATHLPSGDMDTPHRPLPMLPMVPTWEAGQRQRGGVGQGTCLIGWLYMVC
jgi:hypothetical protein